MTQPTVGQWHVDAALTNLSIAMLQRPQAFVASRVFPNVPVMKASDKYFKFPRGAFNRDDMKARAPGARAARGGFDLETDNYSTDEFALEYPIPDQVRANSDAAAPPEQAAREYLTHQALIRRERRFVQSFFTSGIWGTTITGDPGTPATGETDLWSDYTDGDPIGDIRTGIDTILGNTGIKPNKLTMGRQVFSALIDHPDIQGRINGGATTSQPSIANLNLLAQIFEVDEVIVGEAIYNTAAEGQTASHSFILGKNALLSYAPPSPGIMTPSAGYHFSWQGYLPGANEFGFVIDSMRDEPADSDVYRARMADDPKLVAAELGYFFASIVA